MRVLHILNHIQEIGNGIVNEAVDLACMQARAGHEVGIASAGGGYERLLTRYGVRHFDLDQTRKPVNLLKASRRYRTVVREFQPDIVHAHMMTGAVIAKSLRWRAGYGLVTVVQTSFRRSALLMGLGDRVIVVNEADARSMKWRSVAGSKIRVVRNGSVGSLRVRPISDYQPLL